MKSPSKTQRFLFENQFNSSSPTPKALIGRNCLLGPLVETTFTSVSRISEHEAVVCAENGAICVVDDRDHQQKLTYVTNCGFAITSTAVDDRSEKLLLGGRNGQVEVMTFQALRSSGGTPESSPSHRQSPSFRPRLSSSHRNESHCDVIAMGFLDNRVITVDSNRAIRICERLGVDGEQKATEVFMPAHKDSVLGVGLLQKTAPSKADFFTWSSEGNVSFWDFEGKRWKSSRIELEQVSTSEDDIPNELKILRASDDMHFLVSGDRYGVIR